MSSTDRNINVSWQATSVVVAAVFAPIAAIPPMYGAHRDVVQFCAVLAISLCSLATVGAVTRVWAVLLLIQHDRFADGPFAGEPVASVVRTVAFPGLGTGVGKVGPNACARQVRAAVEHVLLGQGAYPQTWADAQVRHQMLYADRSRDLQRD